MKRAVIYARYSSDKQREESIDAQVRACKEYCRRKHYIVTKIYADEAKTGREVTKRDAYNQMITDAAEGKFDIIIFHKLDRNHRDEYNYYTTQHTLNKLGIPYKYVEQEIIDNTPMGKYAEAMMVANAAWFSRNLGQEVKKGQKENALKAIFNGGRPPLGYKIVNQQYVIEPREAEAVKLIFDMYRHGNGYIKIAAELNRRGYTTRNGKPFAKNSLYEILGNERYTGTYIFNRICTDEFGRRNNHKINPNSIKIEGAIPAIIDRAIFDDVQVIRKKNKTKSARFRAVEKYLLSGKIRCALCGQPMSGHRMHTRSGLYVYYCCNKSRLPAAVKCKQKLIPKAALEKSICKAIANIVLSEPNRSVVVENIINYYKTIGDKIKKDRQDLTNALKRAENKLTNLYALVEAGTPDAFDIERINAVKHEILDIKNSIELLPSPALLPELDAAKINNTFELWLKKINEGDESVNEIILNTFVYEV